MEKHNLWDNPHDCPYCDKPLDGPTIHGLHEACALEYEQEMIEIENNQELLSATE